MFDEMAAESVLNTAAVHASQRASRKENPDVGCKKKTDIRLKRNR